MNADLVIRGGTVVDGSGAPRQRADVAVAGGRITEVGPRLSGRRVLDASGLVVAPGFIDIHTHYDAQVLWDPALTPSCWHGVTTVIMGNCGFGLAPCRTEHRELAVATLEHVEGMSRAVLDAGVRWEFETFAEYLDAIERARPALNVAAYVGHSAVRTWVMGAESYERQATPDELGAMARTVAAAVEAGAIGFSTSANVAHNGDRGRPVPSRLATREEVVALASAVGRAGHGVTTFLPGNLQELFGEVPAGGLDAIAGSAIRLADVLALQPMIGRPLTWCALITLPDRRHERVLEIFRDARRQGGDVWMQVSCRPLRFRFAMSEPFIFDMTAPFAELHAIPRSERVARYADASWRAMAFEALENGPFKPRWSATAIAETERRPDLLGRSVTELAAERGTTPLDVMCELALDDDLETRFEVVLANDHADALAELLATEGALLGLSDAGAHADQICDACFATDLLATFVRERGVLRLEEAVRKLTAEPASVFGLHDRGLLAPGRAADITIFDPATVAPGPLRRVHDLPAGGDRLLADAPQGVEHVLVNGIEIRKAGVDLTGSSDHRPGQVLRSA